MQLLKLKGIFMKISVYLTHNKVDCWNFLPHHKETLEKALPGADLIICQGEDEFLKSLSDAEVALIWFFKQEWFELAPNLKWIITPAAGKDYFQVNPPGGIEIDYCTFHGEIMAETVVAYILAHKRGISQTHYWQNKMTWPRGEIANSMAMVRGNSVVILGFGHIGQWIGRLIKPFGVKITGVKRSLIKAPDYFDSKDQIVTLDGWTSALNDCDHLILALPRNNESDNILKQDIFSLLPSGAAVYNVGRGNAIDEKALFMALKEKRISAAYLDVFQKEPLSEKSPLRELPNCFIMPHISACAPRYMDLFIQEFVGKYKLKFPKQD